MENYDLPEWTPAANLIIKPDTERINLGWNAGEKPPPGHFNWFWSTTYKALEVLQDHRHDDRYHTRMEMSNLLGNVSPKGHQHEGGDVISKVSLAAIAEEAQDSKLLEGRQAEQFADNVHYHDDRYYTESELDNKLNLKSNSGHTHNYSPDDHIHSDIYKTEEEIYHLASMVSVQDLSILQGSIEDGERLPLPSGFTESECQWMVSPRHVVTTGNTNGYDDGKGIRFYVDNNRDVVARFDGLGGMSGTANYMVIGVKK